MSTDQIPTRSLPPDVHAKILATFRSRADTQNISLGDHAYLTNQAEFLVGAMATLTLLGYSASEAMPPGWVINIMQGRVVE